MLLMFPPASAAGANCSDIESSPVVDFSYAVAPAETAPIMVNFYSTSDGGRNSNGGLTDPIESYSWNFGDDSASQGTNPLHTYAMSSARYQAEDQPYGVTLTVKTACGNANATTKNVAVYCLDPKAGFTVVQPVGEGPYTAPAVLYLQDTSLHVADEVTTWHYTLWDAGMTRLFKESTEKDPIFIIRNGGSFLIRQEVFKACSNPTSPDTVMTKNIEVTGSAASDAIPMDTIPFTTTVPAYSGPATQAATAAPTSPATTPAPLPAGAPPGTGTLSVVTSPAGAQVLVNDVLLGSSPATIPGLLPGSYNLLLEKSGYRNQTVTVVIQEGKTTGYSTTLETESGGPGIVSVVAGVLMIAAGAGAAYWYLKKKPKNPRVDWNNP